MHEMSLMASVFEIADRELQNISFERVIKVKLLVGQMANALEDALRLAFEAYSQDTAFAGAELEIIDVPATWHCAQCSHEFVADIGIIICPECQGKDIELIKGKDLLLESLEVE